MVAVESCASAVAADTRSIINENHLAMINGAICKLVLKWILPVLPQEFEEYSNHDPHYVNEGYCRRLARVLRLVPRVLIYVMLQRLSVDVAPVAHVMADLQSTFFSTESA